MSPPANAGAERAEPQSMSMLGLVQEFKTVHDTMPNRSFCFILGAGASVTSGIKSAGTMVKDWIHTLYRRTTSHKGDVPAGWATKDTLGIESFDPDDPAGSYSALYRRMYERDPDAGYAYLEDQMKDAEPSYGYSVLGRILAEHRHRVVITVNFDNLVADSVSLFSKTYPLVCGHELLASFVSDKLRRPLVLKVHRDLLFSPKSTPEEIQKIDAGFSEAIGRLLRNYTPIVIGYGGNDGSLMSCLEELPENTIPGGIFWCYRDGSPPPPERIRKVVAKHKGHLVNIMGFDELLMMLGNELEYKAKAAGQYVLERAEERSQQIVKQAKELEERIEKRIEEAYRADMASTAPDIREATKAQNAAVADAMSDTMQRQGQSKRWWQWVNEAACEPDLARRDKIYQKAIEHLPNSADMLGSYALYLKNVRKDFDAAEGMHQRAIEADPTHANALNNYALFLNSARKDHEAAEVMYQRALTADPMNAPALGNYALLLADDRKDFDAAERMYQRAIEADPKNTINLRNYAWFLADVREDFDAAEGMYKRAIEVDPKDAYTLNCYANFLKNIRNEYDAAEGQYQRAIEADPNSVTTLNDYALFLADDREDFDTAEGMFKRVTEADPKRSNTLINLAKLYFDTGRVADGLTRLNEALSNLGVGEPPRVHVKCWACAYCVWPESKQAEALSHLKTLLLQTEIRTGDWDFSGVIAVAKRQNHPQAKWLDRLAEVVAGRAKPASLSKWPAWTKAGVGG